jgi:hypothetical protein
VESDNLTFTYEQLLPTNSIIIINLFNFSTTVMWSKFILSFNHLFLPGFVKRNETEKSEKFLKRNETERKENDKIVKRNEIPMKRKRNGTKFL